MLLPLAAHVQGLRRRGAHAFIPFLTAGYPDVPTFAALLPRTRSADVLEIGLPFSDPVADGPTIVESSEVALAHGMHLDLLFELLGSAGELPPVVLMTYVNPLLAYGAERFFDTARRAGVAGVILTDLPPEEAAALQGRAAQAGIATVQLVAPTTPEERVARIAATTTGFLYCVAVTGTTGARERLDDRARQTVERVRRVSTLPVVVGFGISTPDQVRATCEFADGVVVGRALVDFVRTHAADPNLPALFEAELARFVGAAHSEPG
jgi:tryptophan synthase alpha chain